MSTGWVEGYCPACGQGTLKIIAKWRIICTHASCPRPTSAHEILAEREVEHIVTIRANGFSVKHPLRERINNQLLHCIVAEWVANNAEVLIENDVEPDVPYRMWITTNPERIAKDEVVEWELLP